MVCDVISNGSSLPLPTSIFLHTKSNSLSNLAIAKYHVLVTGQFFQSARAAGVELIGADADFGPQAKFAAVVETCARIDHDRRAVNALSELSGHR